MSNLLTTAAPALFDAGTCATIAVVGKCWGCGCTEEHGCLDHQTGRSCHWANDEYSFCSVCALAAGAQVIAFWDDLRERDPVEPVF